MYEHDKPFIDTIYHRYERKVKMKKINVLQFICPTGFYGAERWVLALANNSDQEKVRCDLAVTEESRSQNLEILQHYPDIEGKTFKIKMRSRFDLNGITKLCKLIHDRDIDIIHTHGYKSDIIGLIAAKRTGIKCVSTPHGFGEIKSTKLKLFIKLGVFSLKFFNRVVPLSPQLQKDCQNLGIPKQKLAYIQNGVDLKEVEQYRQKNTKIPKNNNDEKTIGYIGQMIPGKNIDHILNIFEELCKKHNHLKLQLLGDGKSREALEIQAKNLSQANKIEFLGFRKDRLEKLSRFDLFVMTSSSEGIPRCLMEAMAMGVPISAYDIPGIDQLLINEETGLSAPYGDQRLLQQQWEKLLFEQEYAHKIAANGRDFILKNFAASRMSEEYYNLFKEILDS